MSDNLILSRIKLLVTELNSPETDVNDVYKNIYDISLNIKELIEKEKPELVQSLKTLETKLIKTQTKDEKTLLSENEKKNILKEFIINTIETNLEVKEKGSNNKLFLIKKDTEMRINNPYTMSTYGYNSILDDKNLYDDTIKNLITEKLNAYESIITNTEIPDDSPAKKIAKNMISYWKKISGQSSDGGRRKTSKSKKHRS